jgi:hypothetical protein
MEVRTCGRRLRARSLLSREKTRLALNHHPTSFLSHFPSPAPPKKHPSAHGAHTLATLASYAVRDGQMRGLCALQASDAAVAAAAGAGGGGSDGDASSSPACCGVCWDARPRVAASECEGAPTPCGHALCVGCAIGLVDVDRRPPRCPFCRLPVLVWRAVGAGGQVEGGAVTA